MAARRKTKTIRASDFSPYRIAEFWSRVRLTPTGCMEFNGGERVGGYGCIEMKGRTPRSHRRVLAHRASYAMTWGICPGNKVLLHTCDTPACINPTHLEPGTQAQNVADMKAKGRARFYGRVPKQQEA